jgi:hypothetical protein
MVMAGVQLKTVVEILGHKRRRWRRVTHIFYLKRMLSGYGDAA